MDERVMKYLIDIDNSIAEIEGYFQNIPKEFNSYRQNTMLKRAVERNLEIIGEAVKKVLKRDEAYINKITEAKSIIGLRNLVIHAYDSVSDENIWAVLINHLPKLKSEIQDLMTQN
ncbi:HepT-like ribonuclease domain-containing protein [Chryseobacterium taklimakanense]|uniref:DUF86 domain-containing protein n=2 Tax=Chryseobacterium taklimakanense TaxID=536441 RepID=A0A239XCU9_9FLAO|nr:HepT-like ribonuclease domain-containing protein [Chryseobacterium taklimakanense]AZI19553.1 DUF86 domain-containing protein [Chryseobacterium taklimakanense]SNV44432.1 Uncharacterized conserved protein [Chryseobacterium taklimakanense]